MSSSSGKGGISIVGALSAAPLGTIFLRVAVSVGVFGNGDAGIEDLRIDTMEDGVRFGANVGVGGSAASSLEVSFDSDRNRENLAERFRNLE